MCVLEKPDPVTVQRIYSALVTKPRSLEDLSHIASVDEVALVSALRFLKAKGMIVSYSFTNHEKFRMVRTQPPRYGWNLPWLDLMLSEEDWKAPWKNIVHTKAEKDEGRDESNKKFRKLLKEVLIDPNLDLIEALEQLEMTEVPLKVFELHNQEPYCLECLKNERRFVRMILCKQSEEHCCPNCGVVRETLLVKRR